MGHAGLARALAVWWSMALHKKTHPTDAVLWVVVWGRPVVLQSTIDEDDGGLAAV